MAVTINGSTGIEYDDNVKHILGTGDDLEIYHDGSDSFIENSTGDLYLRNKSGNDDKDVVIQARSGEHSIICRDDGSVDLYYDGNKKLWTRTDGIEVTGKGVFSNHIYLPDDVKLILGNNPDLEIKHESNLSTIKNTHASGLAIRSDIIMLQNDAGDHDYLTTTDEQGVNLFYDNVKKFSTVSAGAKVEDDLLVGTSTFGGHGFSVSPDHSAGTAYAVWNRTASATTAYVASFQNNGTEVGKIQHDDTFTTFGTSSDYRLKENQVAISDGITRLKTLKPYRFNFKCKPSKTVDGFFAHEVTAVPEATTGTKDEVDSNGKPIYQAIDQSKLVPLLTAALQEAITKIETLETKVAALEAA